MGQENLLAFLSGKFDCHNSWQRLVLIDPNLQCCGWGVCG